MKVGIFIYDNAEVLDFSGPFEVFSTAERISSEQRFTTFLISEKAGLVTARAGYQVKSNYGIDEHPTLDVLIIAGGVHYEQITNMPVIEWIAEQSKQVKIIASVCTGAFLLAQAQVITDQKVTTHWDDIDDLRCLFPALDVIEDTRWVEQGNIVTSAGISAGIDMSLHLVERIYDKHLADNTAKQMEFDRTLVE
ncbi:DJ-1/PfpI family protein [Thalassotalea sp. M1531]|uniref:DJ-1/PfpI family protein n=1 Tax=Thalassotalea algicola TaxID=2716224 RepID=A0A7Y0LFE5_9GAMM|nr:DJ-1/PfpI family protein [Thalassotalea algicola]NMP33493.1 DJ-1/PfpI family protein [Thalassotalea algicola]